MKMHIKAIILISIVAIISMLLFRFITSPKRPEESVENASARRNDNVVADSKDTNVANGGTTNMSVEFMVKFAHLIAESKTQAVEVITDGVHDADGESVIRTC